MKNGTELYLVSLDIGGLDFITEKTPDVHVIARFLENHKPSHVYTNIIVDKRSLFCTIMGAENNTQVYWKYKISNFYEDK